jgi:hypothetical protein
MDFIRCVSQIKRWGNKVMYTCKQKPYCFPIRKGSFPCIPYFLIVCASVAILSTGCAPATKENKETLVDPKLAALGTIEVTAKLIEIPDGAIFKRDLYDYATVLKYQVVKVHRGEVTSDVIFVGHYNPWKPRNEVNDKRVTGLGGSLRQFEAGKIHHMALESTIEDVYMGGIVDKYFSDEPHSIYWAVWTNLE